jgi:hypothetical protein
MEQQVLDTLYQGSRWADACPNKRFSILCKVAEIDRVYAWRDDFNIKYFNLKIEMFI